MMDDAWELVPSEDFGRRYKHWEKKKPRELQAALENLATYRRSLDAGAIPTFKSAGFLHVEKAGVMAIDQGRGKGRGSLAETRIYTYADVSARKLHLITIGGKARHEQPADIAAATEFVAKLLNEQRNKERVNRGTEPKESEDDQRR